MKRIQKTQNFNLEQRKEKYKKFEDTYEYLDKSFNFIESRKVYHFDRFYHWHASSTRIGWGDF